MERRSEEGDGGRGRLKERDYGERSFRA